MAKILCRYSGITFKCEHFPAYLDSQESHHPVFSIPHKKLPIYYNKWLSGELTQVDSYLLFLAILKSTDLVEFRTAVRITENTHSIVASYMTPLWATVQKISGIIHPRFSVPVISISAETATLDNIKYWIKTWNECYAEFISGIDKQELRSRLARRESALEKLIKSPAIPPNKYATSLAGWAAEAAAFPEFKIPNPLTATVTTIADYWKEIIVRCYNTESIISVPASDLQELIDHCEQNLDADIGTIFSYHLFACLQEGKSRQHNFFSIGLDSLSGTGFKLIDPSSQETENAVTTANIQLLIDTAPATKPERKAFATDFAYLKAKTKWELAQSYKDTK